ncbi:hypothetical protein L596_020142 [Steinernema carpocapsae]|uniref:Uncharacterized protein n=1 Tax=Steinernema carpocapsae TaxID=34508 RepID=A0A4U5MSN2_STECR|nr:hypothetical protein L596_020142 [Steinernema carpocapsae]
MRQRVGRTVCEGLVPLVSKKLVPELSRTGLLGNGSDSVSGFHAKRAVKQWNICKKSVKMPLQIQETVSDIDCLKRRYVGINKLYRSPDSKKSGVYPVFSFQ